MRAALVLAILLAATRERAMKILVASVTALALVAPAQAQPVVLDTDIYADVDDVGSLAMLNNLERRNVRLLAVMVNTPSVWGPHAVDAVNTYYGHPDIPIGQMRARDRTVNWKDFARHVAREYPHRLDRVPDAARLYRQTLRRAQERVTIISIGYSTNLARLLKANRQLIRNKVKRLVVMGGQYPTGTEFNFRNHPAAAAKIASGWPTPIVYSGFEVGETVMTGTTGPGPVARAYQLYADGIRPSWDQTATFFATLGRADLFRPVAGHNLVDPATGTNVWARYQGRDSYLVKTAPDERIAAELERLMAPASTSRP
jgi:inosine-uridine nucleoside N-ribohydrolase